MNNQPVCYVLQDKIYKTYLSVNGFVKHFDSKTVVRFPNANHAESEAKSLGTTIQVVPCYSVDKKHLLKDKKTNATAEDRSEHIPSAIRIM